MRKSVLLAATAAATAALALAPMAASAATTPHVLTITKVGGTNVAVKAVLSAGLKSGTKSTFYSPGTTTGIVCAKSTVTETVVTNPAKPGTADLSLTKQTFSSCTSNVTGVTAVKSVKDVKLPYKTTVSDATGFPVKVTAPSATIALSTEAGAITCTYKATKISGKASNTAQSVAFKNQVLTFSAGSSLCPASGDFSATYGPLKDTSVTGDPHVYVN